MLALWLLLSAPGCEPPAKQFVGVGDVVEIDATGHQVTIRHDAIPAFAAAATTRFDAEDAALKSTVAVGQRVRFVLQQRGTRVVLQSVTLLEEGNPGVHDHTPHHGGVVGMVGMTHLEARAEPSGRLSVYVTDRWRRPLPLSEVSGTITLTLPDGKRTLPLAAGAEALEAAAPPLATREVNVEVRLVRAAEELEMSFQLPLSPSFVGAAGIPMEGCVAPAEPSRGGRLPRCTMTFSRPVAILTATPDGSRLLVAAADIGVSAWRVAAPQLLIGFAPAPAVVLAAPEPPHIEVANAVAIHPDGTRAVVALEKRLIGYDLASGRVVEARAGPSGIVRSVAWSPIGDTLLVSSFYDAKARLIGANDGRELGTFVVDREAAAVAFADDGRMVAVGSELGPITLFDVESGRPIRVLSEPRAVARALTFTGAYLAAASDDGVVRVWDTRSDAPAIELATATAATSLVRERGGTRIASAGRDGVVRVYDVTRRALVDELRWHSTSLSALAWAGTTIVSGDVDGHVAFWDAP